MTSILCVIVLFQKANYWFRLVSTYCKYFLVVFLSFIFVVSWKPLTKNYVYVGKYYSTEVYFVKCGIGLGEINLFRVSMWVHYTCPLLYECDHSRSSRWLGNYKLVFIWSLRASVPWPYVQYTRITRARLHLVPGFHISPNQRVSSCDLYPLPSLPPWYPDNSRLGRTTDRPVT